MKNLLAYETASGKTQLRSYVKVAMGLFVLLGVLVGVNVYNRYQMVSGVMAEPRPLETGLIPIPTEATAAAVPPLDECPSDPADWTLAGNLSVPGSNLKGLSPQCAYDQLEKTAAWLYSTYVLGYSRSDAAGLLGLSNLPISYSFGVGQIKVLTDYINEPQIVDLRFPSDHAGLAEWRVDANGYPAVEFAFSGCFRTSSMRGGEVVSWGGRYPVICQYSADFRTRHYVGNVNGQVVTANGFENARRFMWFGYAGDGAWVFLGFAKDWEYDLAQIRDLGVPVLTPTVMAERYGIRNHPLPVNWASFSGQEFANAFLTELRGSD